MKNAKKILGIVPARGGSKRLPRKNILLLNGKPLIAYAIESAKKAGIDRVVVSTDDHEIAEIAKKFGAEVPFLRPSDLAQDSTPDSPVFRHVLEYFEKQGYEFDYVLNLRPTAPLRLANDIKKIVEEAVSGNFDLVRSVTKAEGTNHPHWMYKTEEGELVPLFETDNIAKYKRSQDLPSGFFTLNGVIDLFTPSQIKENENIYLAKRMGYIEIPRERAIDIDEEIDLKIAEVLLRKK